MTFDNVITDGLDSLVESIEIQSTFGPPITIRDPFRKTPATGPIVTAPGPGQKLPGFDVARMLKPKVLIKLRDGSVQPFAPYGEPGPSRWPWVTVGLVAGLSVLVYRAFFRRCGR
jgi:hypothetical protein